MLKPEILKAIEDKTDYMLTKKLNFLGPVAVTRLNTINSIQMQALNSSTAFKIICFDLEDPWVYYWTRVQKNGNDGDKWLASMKEIEHIPTLMETCFQHMCLNGVYPQHEHYMMCMKAAAEIGDPVTAHEVYDDYDRCATEIGRAKPEAYNYILKAWLKIKNYVGAWGVIEILESKGIPIPPEDMAQFKELEANFDIEGEYDFIMGRTVNKPKHVAVAEEAQDANMKEMAIQYGSHLQPQKEKIISPEELKYAEGLEEARLRGEIPADQAEAPKTEKKTEAPKEEKKAEAPKEEKKAEAPKTEKKAETPKATDVAKEKPTESPVEQTKKE